MLLRCRINKILLAIALLAASKLAHAKDYKAEFLRYFQEGDATKQLEVLNQWEQHTPQDVELLINYFNYYFNQSKGLFIVKTAGKPTIGKILWELQDNSEQTAG